MWNGVWDLSVKTLVPSSTAHLSPGEPSLSSSFRSRLFHDSQKHLLQTSLLQTSPTPASPEAPHGKVHPMLPRTPIALTIFVFMHLFQQMSRERLSRDLGFLYSKGPKQTLCYDVPRRTQATAVELSLLHTVRLSDSRDRDQHRNMAPE